MKLIWLASVGLCGLMGLAAGAAPAPSPWNQPAAALAEQIAGILGPGQAKLTIRNLSSIPADEMPAIHSLLEADLKAHGVTLPGADSASAVRVTLSESAQERLWVAEVVEGNETRVAMVDVGPKQPTQALAAGGLMLRRQTIISTQPPLLAMLEIPSGLIALEPEEIVLYARVADGWRVEKRMSISQRGPLARDPRGILLAATSGQRFQAWLAGVECTGQSGTADGAGDWTMQCKTSDDPWPIGRRDTAQNAATQAPSEATTDTGTPTLKAFYNAARNHYTGVVTPGISVDLPPFYTATPIARPAGKVGLLIGGIDGKVALAEDDALHPVAGARDWGSDFAVLHSGCGAGVQIISSGSGQAVHDSLRAYELPAFEAVPASAPLAMDGTVTALWTAQDGKSVFAAVRNSANEYEVDRVTALCN